MPVSNCAVEYITVRCEMGKRHMLEISVKDIDSMVVIVVRQHSNTNLPAFKVVNRIPDLQLRFRQHGTNPLIYPRYILKPAGFMYFSWSDPSLPKAVELAAVDYLGNESPTVTYKLENVSSSLTAINVTTLENKRRELKAQVVVEGHTRVLIISNPDNFTNVASTSSRMMKYDLLCSAMSTPSMTIFLTGVSVSLIDEVSGHFSLSTEHSVLHRNLKSCCHCLSTPSVCTRRSTPVSGSLQSIISSWTTCL